MPPPAAESPAERRPADETSIFGRPAQRLLIEFSVHRISAPAGTFTRDESLWRIAGGSLPSAGVALDLVANGIRSAVGRESDRAAMKAVFDKLVNIRAVDAQALPDPNRVIEIEVGPCEPRQTVFYYDHRGQVHGLDFQDGKSRFRLVYELRYTDLHEVWLELVPEIEEPPGPPKWVIHSEGRAEQVEEERRHPFTDLAFSAKIPPGGFLLLGPTAAIYDRPLLGRALFVESTAEGEDATRESVYVISPVIRTVEQRPVPGSSAGRPGGAGG